MQALADNPAFWVLLFAVLAVVYLLPTLIALIRGTDAVALVFLVNLIGGLSGVGWLGAMILAFGPRRLSPASLLSLWPEALQRPGEPWVPDRRYFR
jgi:Superinfection immunity protein